MRAVLDPNVVISALLSPSGAPAAVLRAWSDGRFDLVASRLLLDELGRALAYPKLRQRIGETEAQQVIEWLERSTTIAADPGQPPPVRSADPGDDYLLVLANSENAALVSGDKHLLDLASGLPIFSPAKFLALLEKEAE